MFVHTGDVPNEQESFQFTADSDGGARFHFTQHRKERIEKKPHPTKSLIVFHRHHSLFNTELHIIRHQKQKKLTTFYTSIFQRVLFSPVICATRKNLWNRLVPSNNFAVVIPLWYFHCSLVLNPLWNRTSIDPGRVIKSRKTVMRLAHGCAWKFPNFIDIPQSRFSG